MTARIIHGDARALPIDDASVDLIVTSPPYFGLRSYQDNGEHYGGQIGSEPTPAEFVDALIECTREWMRVLKPSGSIWVNLGDKYAMRDGQGGPQGATGARATRSQAKTYGKAPQREYGARAKSLIGLPWRYALRCIDDLGLILRAEVIWSKPNGLPESVTDRVRRSHEQWFHFTREPRYYSAVDEIRESHKYPDDIGRARITGGNERWAPGQPNPGNVSAGNPLGKLPSSVWEIDNEGESLVRCVLSAIHTGALTIDEGERILKGQTWAGEHASGARSTSPATAGSGRQAARPRDTASSGSTAGQSSRTESPSNSATDPSPMDSSSTTSAASDTASATLSQSPSATTCSEDPAPSQPSTQPRPTAPTATSSTTPTPTARQTEAACAESACEQATAAPTGERSAPQPDAPGSVWTIATEPLRVPDHLGIDHFAAFPTEWPRRIIAGWSPRGVCVECGAGRRPVSDREHTITDASVVDKDRAGLSNRHLTADRGRRIVSVTLTGYACDCPEPTAPTTPGVVLDPFGGTGTTALVADVLGRHGITVDLSRDYCRLAEWRTSDPGQRAKAARVEPPPPVLDGQLALFEDDLFGEPA